VYIRVIRGQTQPGKLDELARRWKEIMVPQLKGLPGFRTAYFSGDHSANTLVSVSVWDSQPDEAALNQRMQEFRSQVADLASGQPSVDGYAVLEHV